MSKSSCLFSKCLAIGFAFLPQATLPAEEPVVEFVKAIDKGDLKTVQKMLDDGLNPDTPVPNSRMGYTPLFHAVRSKFPAITEALLKAGADPSLEDGNSDPVMVYATDAGKEEHARVLIRHGVSIDSKNSRGDTPLLRGASYEEAEDLQAKIDLGANLEIVDREGNTALMVATQSAHITAMKVLIKAGAKLDTTNKRGETALTLALDAESPYSNRKGATNTELVKFLIDSGADLNRLNGKGQSVLLLALGSRQVGSKTVDVLLGANPDIGIRDEDGQDALYYAVLNKKHNVLVPKLLALGADPKSVDSKGVTLLMRAAANYQSGLVRKFISMGLSTTAQNQSGQTAVHFASKASLYDLEDPEVKSVGEKIVSVLKLLHEQGASLTLADKDGNTPLHLAAMEGFPGVVSYLLPHYEDEEIQNSEGASVLHLASDYGRVKVVESLLPGWRNIDQRDSRGNTALRNATDGDRRPTILALLKAGADIDTKDENKVSPLSAAFTANRIDQLKFLLKNGADTKSLEGLDSIFLHAARSFHDKIVPREDYAYLVSLLAGLDTNVDCLDAEGRTVLMWVAASNNEEALKAILDREPEINFQAADGRTALMWAACAGAIESMVMLSTAGADGTLRDQAGRTAAEWLTWATDERQMIPSQKKEFPQEGSAVLKRKEALQNYLKQEKWHLSDRVAGVPPLHLAAALGEVDAIAELIQRGSPLDLTLSDGSTPLMEAAANGQVNAVKLLLEKGANSSIRDENRDRAIDLAVDYSHSSVARLFLDRKFTFSEDESSLLRSLVYLGDEGLLREFIQAGAAMLPPKLRGKDKATIFQGGRSQTAKVLTAAASLPSTRMLKILLEFPQASGADEPDFLVSALHHAAGRGRLENVRFLVDEKKVDPNILLSDSHGGTTRLAPSAAGDNGLKREKGYSALSRALEEGHSDVVRYLVRKGVTITGRTRGGGSPLIFVVEHRQDEMLRLFLKNKAPMEIVDFDDLTALHHAAATNHKLAVQLLLQHGADPKAKTEQGLTPLDLAREMKAKDAAALLKAAKE